MLGRGIGTSKKASELAAAEAALKRLTKEKNYPARPNADPKAGDGPSGRRLP